MQAMNEPSRFPAPAMSGHSLEPPPPARATDHRRRASSPFVRYALTRLALIPAQVVFVLWLLYILIDVPSILYSRPGHVVATMTVGQFFSGFGTMVVNIFTGNWGIASDTAYNMPWSQLYAEFLPNSIQIAIFALPLSALLAYIVAFRVGWTRRPAADVGTRVVSLGVGLVPVLLLGLLIEFALFFVFSNAFGDIPGGGLIPSYFWFQTHYGGYPPWVNAQLGYVTRPTGFPMIDGVINHAWTFEAITLSKTLMQALAVALVYVTLFLRHARSIVVSAREEVHVDSGRSRGLTEEVLRHHARREVLPTFLLLFALTIPAYLATQFVIEGVFNDPGIGYLTLTILTIGNVGNFAGLEGMIFLLALVVLVSVFLVDVAAARLDPRGALAR